jgi:hypothetical protein
MPSLNSYDLIENSHTRKLSKYSLLFVRILNLSNLLHVVEKSLKIYGDELCGSGVIVYIP